MNDKAENTKPSLGKKAVVFALALTVIAGAPAMAALLEYYGVLTGTAEVDQSIIVLMGEQTGEIIYDIGCVGGETYLDGPFTIKSQTSVEVPVSLETGYSPDGEGVSTEYFGTALLVSKIVDFGLDVWEIDQEGPTAEVRYKVVGSGEDAVFSAEVIDGEIEGYVLIYYKDQSDRFSTPSEAILVGDVGSNSLPYESDANADEYDYCETSEYITCHGAKIWYVPEDAINGDGTLDWSMADEFLYETELVQFNNDGELVIYPGQELELEIENSFSTAITPGTYQVITTVVPN